jgi:hypothetical protein
MIPLWGSGRAAINDFQNGRFESSAVNAGWFALDCFLVRDAVVYGGKLIGLGGAKLLGRESAQVAAEEAVQASRGLAPGASRFVVGGTDELVGLQNARNFCDGITQIRSNTCGARCADDILQEMFPGQGVPLLELDQEVASAIAQNGQSGIGNGLSSYQLKTFIENVYAVIHRDIVDAQALEELLLRGDPLIAHVDTNHYIRLLDVTTDAGGWQWVQVYDPARGYYEQLIDSVLRRAGSGTEMITIRRL